MAGKDRSNLLQPPKGDDKRAAATKHQPTSPTKPKVPSSLESRQQSKRQLIDRGALDLMPETICLLDSQASIIDITSACKNLLGYCSHELIGKPITDFMPADSAAAVEKWILASINSGCVELDVRMLESAGHFIEIRLSGQWIEGMQAFVCVLRDLTMMKQAEKLKQEVLAMLGHDLRAPLTALQTTMELLSTGVLGQLNEMGQRRAKTSERIICELIAMINDLLDVQRLEAGVLPLEKADVPFSELAEQAIDTVADLANDVQFVVSKASSPVFCDRSRMLQVLINLLTNAIKFSCAKTQIELGCLTSNLGAEIFVRDYGPGIPAERRASIFERYAHSGSSDRDNLKGFGLGLAICRLIVKAHGGSIAITTAGGGGTTISLRLPPNPSNALHQAPSSEASIITIGSNHNVVK